MYLSIYVVVSRHLISACDTVHTERMRHPVVHFGRCLALHPSAVADHCRLVIQQLACMCNADAIDYHVLDVGGGRKKKEGGSMT